MERKNGERLETLIEYGEPRGSRTHDHLIKREIQANQ